MTRALSLTQPWAYAITHLGKRIENREKWRGCSHRGPVWLHASATAGKAFHDCAYCLGDMLTARNRYAEWHAFREKYLHESPRMRWTPGPSLPMGAIVGRARIVDVIDDALDFDRWADEGIPIEREPQRAWWFGGFALVLDEVTAIEPVPSKGALGLWTVPEEVEAIAKARLDSSSPVGVQGR